MSSNVSEQKSFNLGWKNVLSQSYLKLKRWEVVGEIPPHIKKAVIIAAPHTSNWDLPVMLFTAVEMGVPLSWLGKHTIFEGRWDSFFRDLGGIPVDRRSRNNVVDQIAEEFEKRDELYLAISPEGTRGVTEFWKSGFYHIARAAGVPIILGYLDFGRRQSGLGPALDSNRPASEVMDDIRAFYADIQGYRNDLVGPMRLRDEVDDFQESGEAAE